MTAEKGILLSEQFMNIRKSITLMLSVPRDINSHFNVAKLSDRCFCCFLPSFGAYLNGHKHGLSKQSSINLGKTFLQISCIWNIALTWPGSLHIYLLSFAWFWHLSIEQFWFLFWSVLNGVTLKTSNISCLGCMARAQCCEGQWNTSTKLE